MLTARMPSAWLASGVWSRDVLFEEFMIPPGPLGSQLAGTSCLSRGDADVGLRAGPADSTVRAQH